MYSCRIGMVPHKPSNGADGILLTARGPYFVSSDFSRMSRGASQSKSSLIS